MKEKLDGSCPFVQGENGIRCSTPKALPVAKDYITRELGESVRTLDVPGLLCNASDSTGCPVRADLEQGGVRSMYAKPT